jgi:predicted permease
VLTSLWRDLIHAAKSLAQARRFTAVCVLSLGIGMALIIAIPYWARILRMPPVGVKTEGLVQVVPAPPGDREPTEEWSYPDYEELRDARTGIAMIGWTGGESAIAIDTPDGVRTESIATMFVSANYFQTVGVRLARGSGFNATADDPVAAEPVVILGYDYWQHDMAADPEIIGKTLTLDGIAHVIVGVAPEHYSGHLGYQERRLFLPLGRYPPLRSDARLRTDRSNAWLEIHGRLVPGVSIAQANAVVAGVTAGLIREHRSTNELKGGLVVPYEPLGHYNEFRIVETLFFTLTSGVLVVVCLNVCGMMLVRSAMRQRELSIRDAIGASRGRLAQYLLSEAIVLAGLGAALACTVLLNGPPLASWWLDRPLPFEVQKALRLDPAIIALCLALCLATSLLFGFLPAIRFSRPVVLSSLKDDAGVGGVQAGRVHRWAAALQVAIAVPLLVLCAIDLDRVRATAGADLGFEADRLLAAPLNFDGIADERVAIAIQRARANLGRASGVAAATVADGLPLDSRSRTARVSLQVDENTAAKVVSAQTTRVGDGYLETLNIPLLIGRRFTRDDSAGAEMVAVISKTLADEFAPDATATLIGKHFSLRTDDKTQHTLTIVGVARDFPGAQMSTDRAQLLLPLAQSPSTTVFLIGRVANGEQPMKVTAALENTVRDLGPDVDGTITSGDGSPYPRIVTGTWLRRNSIRGLLTQSAVRGGAGGVILLLAALGIYGVVGLMVATRTREIAVRAALGASRRGIVRLILFDVAKLVTPGIIFGLLFTAAIVRLRGDNLGFQVSDAEPLAYVAGAAIAVLVAILASLTHARRAASVQPMVAMRAI